jgi:hypothetical protein
MSERLVFVKVSDASALGRSGIPYGQLVIKRSSANVGMQLNNVHSQYRTSSMAVLKILALSVLLHRETFMCGRSCDVCRACAQLTEPLRGKQMYKSTVHSATRYLFCYCA